MHGYAGKRLFYADTMRGYGAPETIQSFLLSMLPVAAALCMLLVPLVCVHCFSLAMTSADCATSCIHACASIAPRRKRARREGRRSDRVSVKAHRERCVLLT